MSSLPYRVAMRFNSTMYIHLYVIGYRKSPSLDWDKEKGVGMKKKEGERDEDKGKEFQARREPIFMYIAYKFISSHHTNYIDMHGADKFSSKCHQ